MQAERLGGSPGFIFIRRRRLCAVALFSGKAVKESRRFMQAGQTAVLNGFTLPWDSMSQERSQHGELHCWRAQDLVVGWFRVSHSLWAWFSSSCLEGVPGCQDTSFFQSGSTDNRCPAESGRDADSDAHLLMLHSRYLQVRCTETMYYLLKLRPPVSLPQGSPGVWCSWYGATSSWAARSCG